MGREKSAPENSLEISWQDWLRLALHMDSATEEMAREWSLQETKALVEEHIALEEERPEVRTASEHWNKVSKKLREKGFNRSYKSCNKRWYRLEQYAAQISSFDMEEGKQRNYWDMSRAERLEFRDKWPQLRSGDGIKKEIFDSLKKFSHQDTSETTDHANGDYSVESAKEEIRAEPRVELNRQSTPPPPPPPPAASVAALRLNATPLLHPVVTELKQQDSSPDSEKKSKITWPAALCEQQVPPSSQEALDGFKLQVRELRRRRAGEVRRNNETVPYNSTHSTTFRMTHVNQAPSSQLVLNTPNPPPPPPPSSEPTTFGSITIIPPPDLTSSESLAKIARASNMTQTKIPIIRFKRVNPNPSCKLDGTSHALAHQQQPIGSHLNFQTSSHDPKTNQVPFSLHSATSHQPSLQPNESHVSRQVARNGASSDVHQLGCLEQQSVDKGTGGQSHHESAIGGLGVQLGAIAKLLQAKHAAEQEFGEKMLLFVECMVGSLHTMAQANVCNQLLN